MTNKVVRIILIGFGYIAKKRILKSIIDNDKFELVGVISRSSKNKKIVRRDFDVDVFKNIREAVQNIKFDAVYIATPTGIHYENIIDSLNYSKHIISEKSIVTNHQEAIECVNLSKEKKIVLYEAFMYQFHNAIKKLKKCIDEGLVGKINYLNCSFTFPPFKENNYRLEKKMGGGVILDAACYILHAARCYRSKPERINSKIIYERDLDISGSSHVIFENGVAAFLSYSFNNFYTNNVTVIGSDGIISLDRAFTSTPNMKNVLKIKSNISEIQNIEIEPCDHFSHQLSFFYELIFNEKKRNEMYDVY